MYSTDTTPTVVLLTALPAATQAACRTGLPDACGLECHTTVAFGLQPAGLQPAGLESAGLQAAVYKQAFSQQAFSQQAFKQSACNSPRLMTSGPRGPLRLPLESNSPNRRAAAKLTAEKDAPQSTMPTKGWELAALGPVTLMPHTPDIRSTAQCVTTQRNSTAQHASRSG